MRDDVHQFFLAHPGKTAKYASDVANRNLSPVYYGGISFDGRLMVAPAGCRQILGSEEFGAKREPTGGKKLCQFIFAPGQNDDH
jgi:hypothetical protein